MIPSSSHTSTVYSLTTLEDTPRRTLEFLRAISGSLSIRRRMETAGYTESTHQEGLTLLANVASFVQGSQPFVTATAEAHAAAITDLEIWQKTVFRRLRAGVERFFPNETEALFGNLKLSDAMDASLLAKVFLERVAGLPKSKARKSARGVLELFAERGFGPDELRHLEKLVATAESPATETAEETDAAEREDGKATRLERLTALRRWYDDWAETARGVLVRRAQQIRVGIAHRKRPAPVAVTVPAPVPAPAPAPAPVPAPATITDNGPSSRAA